MNKKPTKKIFLSYSSIDKPFVDKLAIDLDNLNIDVWYDKWEIKVGDSLIDKISQGIEENDYLAVVLSQNSINSEWVKREINAAFMKEMEVKNIVILPLLLEECRLPVLLTDRKWANFTNEYEVGFNELIATIDPDNKKIKPLAKMIQSYIVEHYKNGNSWYEKYSNEKIRQGTIMQVKSNINIWITFLVPYNNLNYAINFQQLNYSNSNYFFKIIERNKSYIEIEIVSNKYDNENIEFSWVAEGF